jgi:AmmeMemoRadiSam system protein A
MDEYTALARKTVENYARTGKTIPIPEDLPADFYISRKGIFVTIYNNQDGKRCLRGCVGTFGPTKDSIAEEIVQNAVFASQEDNHFLPVKEEELPSLAYEVSILEPPEQIYSDTELDPEKYGVIIRTADGRCGLLLPDIEGIDSPLQQIGIAAQKGDIDFQREEFTLWRFTVTKHKE